MPRIRKWFVELMERFGIEGYASHHRKGFILTVLGHCILNVVMLFFKVGPGRQSCLLRGEHVTTEEYVTYRKVSEDKNLYNFCQITVSSQVFCGTL